MEDSLSSCSLPNRLADNSLFIIIIIFHIRDLLLFLILLAHIPTLVHRPHIAHSIRLFLCRIPSPAGPQPPILITITITTTTTIASSSQHILYDLILVARITCKIVVQSSMARDPPCD